MATKTTVDESRRQAILDAALDCFLTSGVARTTIGDLRIRSGASVGCIYHHFGSKERLAAQLYVEALADYHEAFLSALRTSRNARAGVEGAVRHHLLWVAEQPERANYLFHCREPEVTAISDEAAKALNASFYGEAGAWLAAQANNGRIRTLAPTLYHALWMGPSLEYARQWLAGKRSRSELLAGGPTLTKAAWSALKPAD
jgi:AcrR family transcriptional regulator